MLISEITLATAGAYDSVMGSPENEKKWATISGTPGTDAGEGYFHWARIAKNGGIAIDRYLDGPELHLRGTINGEAVAYLHLRPYSSAQPNLKWVHDVMVRPKARRTGLASKLYDAAVAMGAVVVSGIYQTPSSRKLWLDFIAQRKHTIRALEIENNQITDIEVVGTSVVTQFNKQVYSRDHTGIQLVMAKDLATIEQSVGASKQGWSGRDEDIA